jgi:hypothetical protein
VTAGYAVLDGCTMYEVTPHICASSPSDSSKVVATLTQSLAFSLVITQFVQLDRRLSLQLRHSQLAGFRNYSRELR